MEWDDWFMTLARSTTLRSKDPSTKVGAVVVGDRRRVLSLGYNGFPRGIADTPERWNDRPTKYRLVQHAERNALDGAECSVVGATVYVTMAPCHECAKSMIQRGITRVVHPPADNSRWTESNALAREMFDEAGVRVEIWKDDNPSPKAHTVDETIEMD